MGQFLGNAGERELSLIRCSGNANQGWTLPWAGRVKLGPFRQIKNMSPNGRGVTLEPQPGTRPMAQPAAQVTQVLDIRT
jgi:hypothetical protein